MVRAKADLPWMAPLVDTAISRALVAIDWGTVPDVNK
jgi:hypothetical protein